jgi:hypothetical protein
MKKIFTIALICATIGFFSTGCVDVAGPGGTTPANPNNPTDPSNPNNPTDPTNPSVPTDPNDPMYPGEPGTYTTNWRSYNTTTSPQKYIGATYDSSNVATVEDEFLGNADRAAPAPYKTTFSDGSVAYSTGKFDFVSYTENSSATDCHFEGTAPEGFVVTDYEYDTDLNVVNAKEDSTLIDSTGIEGTYTTELLYGRYDTSTTIYETSQPILRVSYYKSDAGEIYYGSYRYGVDDSNTPYATVWDNGKTTYSLHPFMGITYQNRQTREYSTDDSEKNWKISTAPSGHKESDYVYEESISQYKYVGTGASGAATPTPADTATPSTPTDDLIDDVEDALGDILDNDGISLRQ